MKILITGFDPFGEENINPAWEAVQRMPNYIKNVQIKKIQIPTVFEKSAQMTIEVAKQYNPDVIICIGQAGGRFGITPERIAINIDDARIPDNEGNQPIDRKIKEDGENAYFTTLPVKAIVEALRKNNIPSSLSNSAGTFVCNHIMYQMLYYTKQYMPSTKVGFIHVPFLLEQAVNHLEQPSMSLETIIKGLVICIETIVDYQYKNDLKTINGAIC